jgi:hypothetical protein
MGGSCVRWAPDRPPASSVTVTTPQLPEPRRWKGPGGPLSLSLPFCKMGSCHGCLVGLGVGVTTPPKRTCT